MEKSGIEFEFSNEEKSYESLDCPICLSTLVKPLSLICGHKSIILIFHQTINF